MAQLDEVTPADSESSKLGRSAASDPAGDPRRCDAEGQTLQASFEGWASEVAEQFGLFVGR